MTISQNLRAFLDMIAWSEGTFGRGDNGYNIIVGGTFMDDKGTPEYFDDYADHPRKRVFLPKINVYSTAAGRYQILARYFDFYKKQLKLKDFSPASQDAIAIQQIREQKALPDIEAGDITSAIKKCANIWASLPGAGYGQRENKVGNLLAEYQRMGGALTT